MSKSVFLRALACMNAFTFSGAQGIMIALYPFLADSLHLSLPTLVACFSFGSFLFIFGSPFWAYKSDIWGRHRVLKIGMAALLCSFSILAFLAGTPFQIPELNLLALIVSRLIYGLMASSIAPVAQSLQADLEGEPGSTRAMMLHSMSLSLGRVAGISLLVFLRSEIKNILLVYLSLIAITFLINSFLKINLPIRTLHPAIKSHWKLEFSKVKWLVAIAFVFTSFVEALNTSLAASIRNIFKMDFVNSSEVTAKLLLAASIGVLFVQALGRVFSQISWKAGLSIGVTSLLVGSVLLTKTVSQLELWLAMGFLVVGIGLIPPFYLSLLRNDCPASQYGRRAGIIGSAHTLGYAFGGSLAALTFKLGSLQSGYVLFIISLGLALACLGQARLIAGVRMGKL